ncbi:MAG: dTDP-4-dehydrorhamnose 3,5-epimerase [Geminicoccaceae bacterium]
MMDVRSLGLDGVVEITPARHADARGFFCEVYSKTSLEEAGMSFDCVQENMSYSAQKGVLRGLHYQLPPRAQDKLVRVARGSIFDVAVDIRRESTTFGRWISLVVSANAWNQILVPKGFAHGFLTLEDDTEVVYKVTDSYSPSHDRSIRFDDPQIDIDWPTEGSNIVLSDKDRVAPMLSDAETF